MKFLHAEFLKVFVFHLKQHIYLLIFQYDNRIEYYERATGLTVIYILHGAPTTVFHGNPQLVTSTIKQRHHINNKLRYYISYKVCH